MLDPRLAGKTALVTGCNNPHGIGQAIALALAAQGVRICAHYFRTSATVAEGTVSDSQPKPRATGEGEMGEAYYLAQQTKSCDWLVDKIRSRGGQAVSIEADLADAAVVPGLFDAAEELGPVDIVINNAAYCLQDTLLPPPKAGETAAPGSIDGFARQAFAAETFDRHFRANTRATALIMAEFARRCLEQKRAWGRIINISTDAAAAFPGEVSYGASKYAIESLSRSAAREFGPLGITVNIVSLGPVQTGWINPELEKMIGAHTPLGRVGVPEDVADVVVFFASEQARWLTGQLIYAGGGHRMG